MIAVIVEFKLAIRFVPLKCIELWGDNWFDDNKLLVHAILYRPHTCCLWSMSKELNGTKIIALYLNFKDWLDWSRSNRPTKR
jgi:hypothetical protein